jgi:hypothetical protein
MVCHVRHDVNWRRLQPVRKEGMHFVRTAAIVLLTLALSACGGAAVPVAPAAPALARPAPAAQPQGTNGQAPASGQAPAATAQPASTASSQPVQAAPQPVQTVPSGGPADRFSDSGQPQPPCQSLPKAGKEVCPVGSGG